MINWKIIFIILFLWNLIIILKKKEKNNQLFRKKENISAFNLGSSHSLVAFNYVDEKNINLAENSQTFYYDNLILEKYFEKLEKKGYCFITISYFSFASKEYWLKEDLIKYYGNLKVKNFSGINKFDCILYKYFPLIWSIRKKTIKKYKQPDVVTRIEGHRKKLEENKKLYFNLELLEKIIKKCDEKSIKVILLTTPFTGYYNDFFSVELLKENFYKYINEIKEKYNLLYLDFSHDYENFNENKYFRDYDHLSEEGSKIFMKVLSKKLKENGININLL